MKKVEGKEKDMEFIVYEPVRRNEAEIIKDAEECKMSTKYSGLYNRGNTCYLNSLLQTLFMTPDFRSHVLSWKYDESLHGKKDDCIPFQLQKLFARLQLKFRQSESTEDLTKSFDWGHQQLLEQHDIQELCRVLFEAIETSLSEHEDNFMQDLFEGISKQVVQCLECKTESTRSDRFLDLSLPIRNEFENIYNNSLEQAFCNFLKTEKLEKDNQYQCQHCNKKVDALKYSKLSKISKVLFIQLNRFDYDYSTDSRRKICDRVTFPFILNMNSFLQ
jgi:ubiquitin carboxyl-terminal hydrolase 47